jgi:hypothetical protein
MSHDSNCTKQIRLEVSTWAFCIRDQRRATRGSFSVQISGWLARLATHQLGHLILGRGNHALGIGGQDILRTLIVKEAVETCEPER